MFRGRHLSRVQQFGLELSLILEQRDKAKDYFDRLKFALVSPLTFATLFPEWVKEPEPEEEEVVDDLDDTEGEWKFTQKVTPEEAERVIKEMMATSSGRVTGDKVVGQDGWM